MRGAVERLVDVHGTMYVPGKPPLHFLLFQSVGSIHRRHTAVAAGYTRFDTPSGTPAKRPMLPDRPNNEFSLPGQLQSPHPRRTTTQMFGRCDFAHSNPSIRDVAESASKWAWDHR
jgi:hypothetical protein